MDCSCERNDSRSWPVNSSAEPSSRVPVLSTDVEPRARGPVVVVGDGQIVLPGQSQRDQRKSAERDNLLARTSNAKAMQQRRRPRLYATDAGSTGSVGMRRGGGRMENCLRDGSLPRPKMEGRDKREHTNKNKQCQHQDVSPPSADQTSWRPHGNRQPQKLDHHQQQRAGHHTEKQFFGNFDDTRYWDYAFRLTIKSDMGHHCRECRRPFVQLNQVIAVRR